MTNVFKPMTDDYMRKRFPKNSVFYSMVRSRVPTDIAGILFLLVMLAGLGYVFAFVIQKAIASFDGDMKNTLLAVGIINGIVAILIILVLFSIFVVTKRVKTYLGNYFEQAEKESKLPQSELERFEQQVMSPDCQIFKLTSGLDRVLTTDTKEDGFITTDYIYFTSEPFVVIRMEDICACCMDEYSYYVGKFPHQKKVYNVAFRLIASNGITVRCHCSKEAGSMFIQALAERNSKIDTNDGHILPEGEFDTYYKRIMEAVTV